MKCGWKVVDDNTYGNTELVEVMYQGETDNTAFPYIAWLPEKKGDDWVLGVPSDVCDLDIILDLNKGKLIAWRPIQTAEAISDLGTPAASKLVRKTFQAMHCIDFDTFTELMYHGKDDYYTRDKFDQMQRNTKYWFCELDSAHANKFMEYVLNKEG